MSGNSRHTPSPAPSSPSTSKLPKFLQKQTYRERSGSKNAIESGPGDSPNAGTLSSGNSAGSSPEATKPRKTSKFLSITKDREDKARKGSDGQPPQPHNNNGISSDAVDEAPVIVEPVNIPRPRTRPDRPVSSAPEIHHHHIPPALYSSASSTSRIGDLPTRLSGWFQHTFSTSSTDLSTLLAHQASPNKGAKSPNALLTAARHGKGHLDKAMRYLLDSDATPDKCLEPIWLLGVQHPGYEPPPTSFVPLSPGGTMERRRRGSASPPVSFRSSTSSVAPESEAAALSQSTSSLTSSNSNKHSNKQDPSAYWPPVFYLDYTSRIWLTYRSQFPIPIRDGRLADLSVDNWPTNASSTAVGVGGDACSTPSGKKSWPWSTEKTWSSDSGWGCMLRTGQSLLANSLIHAHLGRDWRRPPHPVQTADYATYVQILTWFLDTPAPETPFSVHRMALAGKEFGTDVGQWFGPSVAAGAIRTLVSQFPESGLAVSVAVDSILYQTQVFAASQGDMDHRSPRRPYTRSWGDKPVLLLLGIRLGIEGVNPIYYETIKRLYEFPQSVGIAGGRPSSSYYFVGSQAENLFYLDPHNTRPAIPLRPLSINTISVASERRATTASPSDSEVEGVTDSKRNENSDLDPLQMHFCTSYGAGELRTFHCERVRKMPLSGLDPSMLIGFLCRDEADWWDFRRRVSELPKTIFSVQDEPPTWPADSDDNMGLESMSDPDDLDLDDDEDCLLDAKPNDGEDDDSGEEEKDDEDDDNNDEPFFDTQSASAGSNQSHGRTSQTGISEKSGEELDIDTEDDPVGPITPGPGSRFEFVNAPSAQSGKGTSEERDDDDEVVVEGVPEVIRHGEGGPAGIDRDEGDDDEEDDDDDDWTDPCVPSPTPPIRTRTLSRPKEPSPSPPSSSNIPPLAKGGSRPPPPLALRSRGSSSLLSKSKSKSTSKEKLSSTKSKQQKTRGKQTPVPVPAVVIPLRRQQQQEHYPFPVTPADDGRGGGGIAVMPSPSPSLSERHQHQHSEDNHDRHGEGERSRQSSATRIVAIPKQPRMHMARARDGGRTQSGGVKGILPS